MQELTFILIFNLKSGRINTFGALKVSLYVIFESRFVSKYLSMISYLLSLKFNLKALAFQSRTKVQRLIQKPQIGGGKNCENLLKRGGNM